MQVICEKDGAEMVLVPGGPIRVGSDDPDAESDEKPVYEVSVSAFYIVAQLALGLHLYHGIWSMLHTLGLSHPRYDGLRSAFSTAFALIVVVGNISIPIAVLAGCVK